MLDEVDDELDEIERTDTELIVVETDESENIDIDDDEEVDIVSLMEVIAFEFELTDDDIDNSVSQLDVMPLTTDDEVDDFIGVLVALENDINEGSPYPYYSDYSDLSEAGTGNDTNRIKYINNIAQKWWLRSPYFTDGNGVRCISTTGEIARYTNYSYGVVPACNII